MSVHRQRVENGGLILFVVAFTLALGFVVSSFAGALLWATLAALLFQPLFERLLKRWPDRRNTAAAVTMLIITFAVVIPALIVASLVVEQAASVYNQMRSGQINFASYFQQMHDALPTRLQRLLDSAGFDSFERAQTSISQAVGSSASMLARQAFSIGANAAAFLLAFGVGLYVTFFLLRDGGRIGPAIVRALPLEPAVAERFAIISADPRHRSVQKVSEKPIAARQFPEWTMGFRAAAGDSLRQLPGYEDFFGARRGKARIEHAENEAQQFLEWLGEYWFPRA